MRLIVMAMLLSGCVKPADFGIESKRVWCVALLEAAPTGSSADTPETLEGVADIGDTIDTLCEDFL